MKFVITIEEMVSQDFEVEADDMWDALDIAEEKYNKCEFVLEPGNLVAKQIAASGPYPYVTKWAEF